ncbi:serine/threonine-protein kinase [Dokdonella sp.]|uniref:serine/threonine-protein kinase n=1 Tax=Dokdonella sp. TaxID=2291710 RepID=UPI002630B214|nr:serine/threonine-protein kinase [Dokdonella sp.]
MAEAPDPRAIGLLRAALERPVGERQAWLEQACGGDAALHALLQRLLSLDAGDDPWLDGALDEFAARLLPSEQEDAGGERIGPWRLLRLLGRGGMGTVWLAERVEGGFVQQVALKRIRLGMDSCAVEAQFRREREVLGRLRHPHIALLVDGGVDERGRPWFAMELVDGIGLREWLQRDPPLRARLELFLKLCRAVAHAHAQLVVHRDLKPANVLVQADDEPRLLDFGIAKLLHAEVREETAVQHFLTRAYAAPEQLRGEPVSTATDVFALGALLFELLTGAHCSDSRDRAGGVPRPSTWVRQAPRPNALPAGVLRGDLDAIVQRATAEEPGRRYGTAQALGDDVQRYLDGRSVAARPDGFRYRLGKLVRRNRVASAAFLLAVLAIAAGVATSLWHAHVAGREASRAIAVKRFLVDLFDDARNSVHGIEIRERSVASLLADGAMRLRTDLGGEPEVRDELYEVLVEIFDSTGDGERSIPLARERVAAAEASWGVDDPLVAPSLVMLAGVLINHGRSAETEPLLARAQRLLDRAGAQGSLEQARLWTWDGLRRVLAEDAPSYDGNPLRQAADLLRRKYSDRDELFVALYQLAQLAALDQRHAAAEEALAELRQQAIERHGGDSLYVTHADHGLASLMMRTGRHEQALIHATAAVAGFLRFEGESHPDTFAARLIRIEALLALGRRGEAQAAWREVNAVRERSPPDGAALREQFADVAARIESL